jgi:predicted NAD/FAD-binding protein
VLVAAACAAASAAQRVLSTPVRWLRRDVAAVEGRVVLRNGEDGPLDAAALRAAPERALRLLSAALPLLAAGLVVARLVD